MSPPAHPKKKVVFFLHFLAETPSHGYIFYEKLVWPPKILTTGLFFSRFLKKVKKHGKMTPNRLICNNSKHIDILFKIIVYLFHVSLIALLNKVRQNGLPNYKIL